MSASADPFDALTAERAASLTSWCTIDFDWRAPADSRYLARLWASPDFVYGCGATVLEAVVAAHRARVAAGGAPL